MSGPPYPEVAGGVTLHKLESLNLYESNGSFRANLSRIRGPVDLYEFMAVSLGTFPEPFTFSIRAYRRLQELLPHKFDIIHDNQGLGYGLLLMKRLKVPVVATIHHPIPIDRDLDLAQTETPCERFRLKRWYSFCTMQRITARRLDRIITVSNSSAEAIQRCYQIPSDRIRVVHNGVDCDLFERDHSVSKEPNSLILVNSGEGAIKGAAYLLKALQLLSQEEKVKLSIVGNPNPDGLYLRLVRKYGLEEMITFTGRITPAELVRCYSATEIAVIPSLYEGFGFPAAEGMSCGLPVVSTSAGALPEVVGRDGSAGILVPPADPDALAAAIKRLLSDEPLRRRMGEAGRRRIESNFDWKQAAEKMVGIYEEML